MFCAWFIHKHSGPVVTGQAKFSSKIQMREKGKRKLCQL